MVQVVSAQEARMRRTRRVHDGMPYHRTDYLVPPVNLNATLEEAPLKQREAHAFIVEQEPDSVVGTHFHISNQFQVVVDGDGTLGRHPVSAISVHYAGAYTGYGPITAGDRGLAYLTLRAQYNAGPKFLPEARAELRDVVRQTFMADNIHVSDTQALSGRQDATLEIVIEAQENGLAAYLVRLGPRMSFNPPATTPGGGQYWVVIAGNIIYGDIALAPLSCLFVKPDDPQIEITADDGGAEVLVLQFPSDPDPRPKTDQTM